VGPPTVSNTTPSSAPADRRVCYLSRTRGWIDPDHPRRPTSEVNLLAVALGSPVWTMGTAWETTFHHLIPLPVARAFRSAMVRTRLTYEEVDLLKGVAEQLHIDLVISD
jgi:hypothetical protein